MDEKHYRESRLCRLLGNPIVYQMVTLLDAGGAMTPSKPISGRGRGYASTLMSYWANSKIAFRASATAPSTPPKNQLSLPSS